jgi:hypothetical protein
VKRRAWRLPLLASAVVSAGWGVWLGLLRLGWALPLPWPDQLILHGPLMIGGFLGTLVGLERAIGIARPWAYAAPAASAAGAALLVVGTTVTAGAFLITTASGIVTAVFIVIVRAQPSLFATTMLAGSASWLAGNVLWSSGYAIFRVVYWWIAFLVLTIAGERLELNRLLRPAGAVRAAFVAAVMVVIAGVSATEWAPSAGVRLTGVGLGALCGWLAVNDIARRTIRQPGVTRYIAVSMLLAYCWLGIGAAVAIVTGAFEPGPAHDAILHAIFLGFALSMVFGHAPIVLPAVTGLTLRYRPMFYAPLLLLQFSMAVRLVGDLIEELGRVRAWGGLLNAFALLMFLLNTASSARWRSPT